MDIIVWLIEDDPLYKESIEDLITESDGMICGGAFASCEAAIKELHSAENLPDVVLMDIELGTNMSGVKGAGEVKSILPSAQIIMLTIHQDNNSVFDALRSGASGYILKEQPMPLIVQGIREAYDGGVPMTGAIARKVLNTFRDQGSTVIDYQLTKREKEILELIVDGHPQHQIAKLLFISPATVDSHVRNIYTKLHVNSRARVVAKAIREGLV